MARRRIVVAFQEVESPQGRLLRHMLDGDLLEEDLSGPRRPAGRGRYWCAADRPVGTDEGFQIAAVYRTHDVPEGARCEACSIEIRELQEAMGAFGGG